jgi:phage-related minor tail protein
MSDSYDFDFTPRDEKDPARKPRESTDALSRSVANFASAITKAFAQATTGGKRFDDVLKQLALKLSSMAVMQAAKPLGKSLGNIFNGLFSGTGDQTLAAQMGAIKPFAAGGVIGTPTYFPLSSGGLGLAGEAGPEAIVPLARGADGRLGVAMQGGGAPAITVQIATPDASSFKRSEAYITGQIARAGARGQRGM